MTRVVCATALGCGLAGLAAPGVRAAGEALSFQARHEAVIREIPAGAKKARIWLVVPREDPAQKVGRITLTGPGKASVRKGGTYHNRYAYFEVENPGPTLNVAATFTLERHEANTSPQPSAAQPIAEKVAARHRVELAANTHVPVNDRYRQLAHEIVGDERNPVVQAKKVYDWVLGIPTRMVYGSFFQGESTPIPNKASLDGKDTDASYHCWVEFFAPGVGWVPLDVALADLLPTREQQEWYFGNLDARRVTWSYGRDLILAPKQDGGPVNAMHKVYVEIDGKPHAAWERKFTYVGKS
jgi:transglutaminase-like putative cysteine protease